MSDNKYVNKYIDVAVGTVHELLNQVLQLKTEARLANDLVSEKDQVISTLESSLTAERSNTQELNTSKENAKNWENEVNHLRSKVSHMDNLSNQFNEVRNNLITKTKELEEAKAELDQLKEKVKELSKYEKLVKKEEKKSSTTTPKKDINKEISPLSVSAPKNVSVVKSKVEEETDDF